jgi:hypothetical protein
LVGGAVPMQVDTPHARRIKLGLKNLGRIHMASDVAERALIDDPKTLAGAYPEYPTTEKGFGTAYIDIDEWRDKPRRHRYIHGGFDGNHTRFSIYLPPAEHFKGRVLKHLEGGSGGNESLFALENMFAAPWQFDFAFEEFGAVLMESNQGHFFDEGIGFHNDVYLFGASAESARFAKWLALKLYGAPVHHAYVFGASGGGHRSYQCLMHRGDVFDGGVPEVCGVSPGFYWSAQALAIALIGDKMAKVADACEPGGGDPFKGLSYDQREALADLFRLGYPKAAVNQLQTGAAPFALYNSREYNPGYFKDFWTKPGYLGHDDPDRLAKRHVKLRAKFKDIATAKQLSIANPAEAALMMAGSQLGATQGASLDIENPGRLYMAFATVKTGKAAGREMVVSRVLPSGHFLPFVQRCPEMFDGIEPGDEVELDNSDWIAFNYLYKHNISMNVPGLFEIEGVPGEYADLAFDGTPVHEQTGEILYDLNVLKPFTSKMIVLAASLDCMIWPTKLTPLVRHLRATQGDKAADTMRFWWVENATHGPPEMGAMVSTEHDPRVWRTRLVDYAGPAKQALLDVAAWAERGVTPPDDSRYAYTRNNQLTLPDDGGERGGVQPSAHLTVNGGERADVKVGETVTFRGSGAAPAGGGQILRAEIDFVSDDSWPYQANVPDGAATRVSIETSHSFDKPGVYFPSFRVSAWRDGLKGKGLPIQNLARVRVVVSA